MIEIQEKEHSEFSPSSLERRLNCSVSLVLEKLCKDTTGYGAAEGTAAHYVSERVLSGDIVSVIDETIKVGEHEIPVDEEMIDHAMDYMKYIAKCCKGLSNFRVHHEQAIILPGNDGRVFGWTDTVILSDTETHVIDYKYGKVDVSPKGNKQVMGYTLGVVDPKNTNENHSYYGHIVQPRARFSPGAASCKYEIEELQDLQVQIDDLVNWLDGFDTDNKTSLIDTCSSGEHCHYCKAIHICPRMHDRMLKIMIDINSTKNEGDDSQLFAFLHTEQITKYLKKCKENLEYKAAGGEKFSGVKVVRGIKQRFWDKDVDMVLKELTGVYHLSAPDISDVKIKSIGEVKKLVGAKDYKEIEKNLTIKPTGELTIAPVADRRKAVELELDDFKDE